MKNNCVVTKVLGNGEYEFSVIGSSVIRKENLDCVLAPGNDEIALSLEELDKVMNNVPDFQCNLKVGDTFYLDAVQIECSELA